MWSNVVIAWVIFVPPLYLMVEVWRVAASYAYVWLLVYVLLLASVYTWRFRRGTWKTIEIKEHVDAADGCAELADGVAASLS
jgi:Na+-driven multidrug efflux pump